MRTILWLHVGGGGVALAAGYAALCTSKGSRNHRVSGRVFVYAMLAMSLSGAGIAAATGVDTSVVMGTLAAYLVVTGFTTVSPLGNYQSVVDLASGGVALILAATLSDLGRRALASPDGVVEGLPALMAFVFAAVAVMAGIADVRLFVKPSHRATRRLVRHLWRMSVALFIAAASFFLGQPAAIPQALRHPLLLAIPVLTPLVAMGFWMWRTRARQAGTRAAFARGPLDDAIVTHADESGVGKQAASLDAR